MLQFIQVDLSSFRVFLTIDDMYQENFCVDESQELISRECPIQASNSAENTEYNLSADTKYADNDVVDECCQCDTDIDHDIARTTVFNYIRECTDQYCIYTRAKTNIRIRFEDKITASDNKAGLNILFYSSYLLQQELTLITKLKHKINEVHFTDIAYHDLINNCNSDIYRAFAEFCYYIQVEDYDIRIYVHCDPHVLTISPNFSRRMDIICGIDIDYIYHNMDNRDIMKKIAFNTMKIDGYMIISQNNMDLVDLCRYELDSNGDVMITHTEDFVKPGYYRNYWIQYILDKLKYPVAIGGLLCGIYLAGSWPMLSIIASTYYAIDIIYSYLLDWNNASSFERVILPYSMLI